MARTTIARATGAAVPYAAKNPSLSLVPEAHGLLVQKPQFVHWIVEGTVRSSSSSSTGRQRQRRFCPQASFAERREIDDVQRIVCLLAEKARPAISCKGS
jgi:hypothetical protein